MYPNAVDLHIYSLYTHSIKSKPPRGGAIKKIVMKKELPVMKKFLAMALSLAMVLSLAACGSKNETPAENTDTPAESTDNTDSTDSAEVSVANPGKLTVATSPDFAPYEFYAIDANGNPQLAGFDVALAGYIADYMGLELDIIPMDFDGVLNELAAGSVDLGMAGLSPDPERADAMDFSDIYYMGGQSFVCLQSNKDQFTSLEDTNKPELSIGAQNGSIQKDLADQNSPDADIVVLTKVTDIVAELLSGKLDGAYIETAVAETYAKQYPDLCVVLDVPYDSEGSAVGVAKGNDSLMAAVNEAIAAALADGSMDKFVAEANDLASGDTASLVDGEIVADEK